ncbi:MAG TPA: tetratricopeptide repeat protein, partial [Terriglobales bacterium]|nr:tetratricopeptide repeat protein [Terriglobales bacterium]
MTPLVQRAAWSLATLHPPRLVPIILLWLACLPAHAQTQTESRQQLLRYMESGQLKEAVLLGQQAVSRWPRDPLFRHYLGVAYFKSGDPKQAQEQLGRACDLDPKDSAAHFDLA